jgi:hypothetical protein
VPAGKLKEKNKKKIIFFASLKSLKKKVGSGSGSISQRCGSPDPDPHQNVTDPQHCIVRYPNYCIAVQGEPDMREAAGGRDAGPEEQAHQTDGRAQSHARAGPRGQVLTPVALLFWMQCFRSGFIDSGSGSRILGGLPIRIQVFYEQKFEKIVIFLIKNCN